MRQVRRASRREAHSWPEVARGEEGGVVLPPLALDGCRRPSTLHLGRKAAAVYDRAGLLLTA